jgi:RHS repeat-associated protein
LQQLRDSAQANTVNQTNKNAYVIFGYVNATNFQYAGYDIAAGKWAIGDVVNGTKTDRASFSQTITTAVWHTLDVKLDASTKVVTLKGVGVTKVIWTFTNLYSLPIGLAIKGGQTSFDNFKIAPAYTVTNLHTEDFNDGQAQGYVPAAGTWSIVSSRYRGTIATTTDAVSLTPVSTFNSGVISADLRVVTNNGWVIFDYVNSTNFKFAGIDEPADKWVIGDVVNGTKTYRASFTQTLNVNTIYPAKVLLEGSTVTIVNSNTVKVRFAFASLTARPVGVGLRGSGTCEFDNMLIYTEAFPSGPVSNPPAVPAPTSTAGAADLGVLSYDSPPFYYHLNDHLGTTRIITNAAGVVTGSFEYWPFGELKSSTGCAASSQRFTGKLFDNESGLQYFGARYLSNDLTRFTSVDPAAESFDTDYPQSWNRYSYSGNSPINLIDPDGRAVETIWDVISLAWDVYDVTQHPTSGPAWAALGIDVVCTAVPFVPAVGRGAKLASEATESVKAAHRTEEIVLDTSTVISHGKDYVKSGENVVKSKVTDVELRALTEKGKIQYPSAANQIPSVDLPNVDTRINVRGNLQPGRKGNFQDGIVGATAIERKSKLVTGDKQLSEAVNKSGGKAEFKPPNKD